jgi:hypothetical protein
MRICLSCRFPLGCAHSDVVIKLKHGIGLSIERWVLRVSSNHLGEFGLHALFIGEQLLHARPLLHALEMRRALLELP